MGAILANFRHVGIFLCLMKLNMFVRDLMACVPKCFMCKFETPLGPMENVFLAYRWLH